MSRLQPPGAWGVSVPAPGAGEAVQQTHVHTCLQTHGAYSQWEICHWEEYYFLVTFKEVCPLLLGGTMVIWCNSSPSSKQCSHWSNTAWLSANQEGALDWVTVQVNGWGKTMQKYHRSAKTSGYAISVFGCMLRHAGSFGQAQACSAKHLLWLPTAANTSVVKNPQTPACFSMPLKKSASSPRMTFLIESDCFLTETALSCREGSCGRTFLQPVPASHGAARSTTGRA